MKRYVCTAPSMDGYASDGAPMICDGFKISFVATLAYGIVGDTDIMKEAPMHLIHAGFGDVIGKLTALADWRLAREKVGEYYCETCAVLCCKCQEDTNMSGNEFYQMTSPCDEESEEYSDSEGNDDIKESIKDRNDNSECCSSGSVSRNKKDNGSNRDINNVSSVSNVSSVRGSDLEGETLLKSTFNKDNTLLNNTSTTTTNNNISTRRVKKIIKRYKKS